MITRWRDDLDGTWHETGDLDGYDYEQEAKRFQYEAEQVAVTVFHDTERDGYGRPLGMLDGYQPDHELTAVFAFEAVRAEAELEHLYYLFNVGDDPTFGEPDPLALRYRLAGNRSLSVGDVIRYGTGEDAEWWTCRDFGWDAIDAPDPKHLKETT